MSNYLPPPDSRETLTFKIANFTQLSDFDKYDKIKKVVRSNFHLLTKRVKKIGWETICKYIDWLPYEISTTGVAYMQGDSLIIDFTFLESQINDLRSFKIYISSRNKRQLVEP